MPGQSIGRLGGQIISTQDSEELRAKENGSGVEHPACLPLLCPLSFPVV